jgi:lipoprotein signal peptidase
MTLGLILPITATAILIGVAAVRRSTLTAPIFLIVVAGLSNYMDQLRFGYVRDPLVIGSLYFNVADICILIGGIWAVSILLRKDR